MLRNVLSVLRNVPGVLRNVQSVLRNVPGVSFAWSMIGIPPSPPSFMALKPIPVGALKSVGVLKQKIKNKKPGQNLKAVLCTGLIRAA